MFRARLILYLIPALAIVVLAGGCGGKEKVTAAELVQKGDAICRDEQSKFDQVQVHPPVNASDAAAQVKALVSAAEDANSALGNLEPPGPVQDRYSTYLDARDRATDQLKKGQDAAENQDSTAYGAAQSAIVQSAPERRRLAASLGLRTCSANPRSA